LCCECGCRPHGHHYEGYHAPFMGFPSLTSIEEEVKMLEEFKEALESRLTKVKKRLETLKR